MDNSEHEVLLEKELKAYRRKNRFKNIAIASLAVVATLGWAAWNGTSYTRDQFLHEKDLEEEFDTWLTSEDED